MNTVLPMVPPTSRLTGEDDRAALRRTIEMLADAVHLAPPEDAAALADVFCRAQEARWDSAVVSGHLEILAHIGSRHALPVIPHCADCAAERSRCADPSVGYALVAAEWFAFASAPDRPPLADIRTEPVPLGDASGSCACGWRAFADSADDVERQRETHDPGDSCCACGGARCLACANEDAHARCVRDCPECCLRGSDGLTAMDRQRRLAHQHAAESDDQAFAFLHSLIDRYSHITHRRD